MTFQDGSVNVSVQDKIAQIVFSHPKSNSLPGSVLSNLAETITTTGGREDVSVIVLSSEGSKAFCAGASFDELVAIDSSSNGKEFFMGFSRVILAMKSCPKIIIGRIQGKAVGGGVGLVSACDYALAHSSASLKLSELAIGIGPFVIGPVVQHRLGPGNFTAMSLDTEWRDAAWALQRGLYAGVYETHEALDEAVTTLATRLASSNPEALTNLKEVFWEGTDHWSDLLQSRAEISGTLVLSDFTQQAIERFAQGAR